ncbi:hypothetical protein ACWKWK_00440 [Pseudoxanthomonas beigongshangi]
MESRNHIVEYVNSPLGFFVLALLIVESFLATVLILSEMQEGNKVVGMYIGVGLFIFVVAIVSAFVWWKPDNLTFDKEAHLRNKDKPPFGTQGGRMLNPENLVMTEPGREV